MPRPDELPCPACGRKIFWSTSPDGAKLPLDARAVTTYTVRDAVFGTPDAVRFNHTEEVAPNVVKPVKVYVSHFLTCLQVSRFSRLHQQAKP